MHMAELSRRSRIPVATIKYYLREGLLPPGKPTSATRAEYGEAHLRRLRLIRALVEIGEIPVAKVRRILERVDDESVGLHDMFGTVQYSLGPQPSRPALDEDGQAAMREVDELITDLAWKITPDAPAKTLLASTLAALRRASAPRGPSLQSYATAMAKLAAKEVASVAPADEPGDGHPADAESRVKAAEAAIAGMVLYERVLVALRRLAQEDASARFYGEH